jgi:hypothetical protein
MLSGIAFTQSLSTGLVAYWPMDGDFSNSGSTVVAMTNVGSVAPTTNIVGVANTAMLFNNTFSTSSTSPAATQYATYTSPAAYNFTALNSFTIGLSFKIGSTASTAYGFGLFENNLNYGGYGIFVQTTGSGGFPFKVVFNFKNGNAQTNASTFNVNTWYHLTAVYNGTAQFLYVNGTLVSTTNSPGSTAPTYTFPARFGTMFYNGGFGSTPANYNPFNGSLDEVRIYNRALSAAEITSLASVSLPLKLTNFNATLQQNTTALNWQTDQEQNTSHFTVERSIDGQNFTAIQNITAAGNSSTLKNYSYKDNLTPALLQNKTLYYRLKMVDQDQSFRISKIIPIHLNQKELTITLSPNPVSNLLQIQTNAIGKGLTNFSIIDANGKVVLEKQENVQQTTQVTTLSLMELPTGNYILKVSNNTNQLTKQFIKSN